MTALWISLRYLRARRDGFISLVAIFSLTGIALGVATLIVVMSVMDGFRFELLNRIVGLYGHITVRTAAGGIDPNDGTVLKVLENHSKNIVSVSAVLDAQVIVSGPSRRVRGVMLRGIDAAMLEQRPQLREGTSPQARARFQDTRGMLIGSALANQIDAKVGDNITVISPVFDYTAFGSVPRTLALPVVGVFTVGMYEYDANFAFVPLGVAQDFYRAGPHAGALEVQTSNADHAPALAAAIKADLNAARQGQYTVGNWQNDNASLTSALIVERNVMFVILTLIVTVAAFNIITGQTMLVTSKMRSVAILRTMGMTTGQIASVFLFSGLLLGGLGTGSGIVLALILSRNLETIRRFVSNITGVRLFDERIYFLRALPSDVEPVTVVQVAGAALLLTVAFSLYPAYRAARISPATVLRDG